LLTSPNIRKCQKCFWFQPISTKLNRIKGWLGFALDGHCLNKLVSEIDSSEQCSEWNRKESRFVLPVGWLIVSAGQSPLHFLWFVHALDYNRHIDRQKDPSLPEREVITDEHDTLEAAFNATLVKIIQEHPDEN
jgi:hypothetical protein